MKRDSSLEKRLEKVEEQVDTHLKESGEVREAIRDLQKAVDTVSGRMWAAAVGSILTLIAAVAFLLKVSLWR